MQASQTIATSTAWSTVKVPLILHPAHLLTLLYESVDGVQEVCPAQWLCKQIVVSAQSPNIAGFQRCETFDTHW